MIKQRSFSISLVLALIAGLFLVTFSISLAGGRAQVAQASSLGIGSLPPPDYDSGWINLPKAVAWDNPGTIIYPDDVYPSETTLSHNLGTYDILVYVLASDGQSRYVPMPSALVGGYGHEDNWFLTSQNQIMLRNWDYNRAVPVHVMIWKLVPDYDSGWVNLPKATQGPGILPPVYPTETTLSHNLGTYDLFVFVLANDGSGKYAQVPSEAIGSYGGENVWFLTSSNQIMLRNWDPYRTVPVHVMIWRAYPDYDSGWINLPKAVPWDNPGTIIYPDDVTPTETSLNHNLGTYNILVNVIADDGHGRYVQIPVALVGGGLWGEDQWFLTSQNQIMLRNWDYNRAVPVHVMIWKPNVQITFSQTGLTPDFTGTVLTVDANNYKVTDLPVSFWWNLGSSHSYAYQSPLLVTLNAKQYLWTSTSGLSTLQSGSITVATSGNVTGNYKTQYYLTVTSLYDSPTPASGWFDSGSSITGSVTSPTAGPTDTRYVCTGWTGTGSAPASGTGSTTMFTITQASSLAWNWKTQYYLTVNSAYGMTGGQGWYDSGATAYATVNPLTVSGPSGTQFVFIQWSGDATGTTSPSNPITMNAPKTAMANWKTQYLATFTQSGLDSSAASIIATINGNPKSFGQLPYAVWIDNGGSVTYSYNNVSSSNSGERFVLTSITGPASPVIVNGSLTVTGNYKTQYQVIFDQTGVGSNFAGSIVSIDGNGYNYGVLPTSFWWDSDTSHIFSFSSPLVVNASLQYDWISTSGLTTLQSGSISITGSGSITGIYSGGIKYEVTFGQNGLSTDFSGTVVAIDGTNYNVADLPVSFWWDSNSVHTFAYQSPLVVTPQTKQYVWTNTSGLSTLQNGSVTATHSGNVSGNYKIQYYLSVTSPYDAPNPTSAWFDDGTSIIASVTSPWSGPAGTRYACIGWSGTGSVPSSGGGSSTAFTLSQPSSITWNWRTQFYLTVRTDPLGIATISGEGWYDQTSPVTLTSPVVQNYTFANWDVDGANQGNGINPITTTMNAPHVATAHYIHLNPLTVHIQPTSATINLGQSVTFTSTVQGGTPPYTYRWYLNDNPVSGATSSGWIFTPPNAGIHYVYLQVTDFSNTTAQSETARIVVTPAPVGGYSVSFSKQTAAKPLTLNFALIIGLALFLVAFKRKTTKRRD
jgi:hypothetical protein